MTDIFKVKITKGSPKQIEWADRIQATLAGSNACVGLAPDIKAMDDEVVEDPTLAPLAIAVKARLCSLAESADFWIEMRNNPARSSIISALAMIERGEQVVRGSSEYSIAKSVGAI